VAECNSCNAPIVWVRTVTRGGQEAGRNMPLDAGVGSDEVLRPKVFEDGNIEMTGRQVQGRFGMVDEVRYVGKGQGPYRSHFASCPNAQAHRRR
jgi:hypothetical protein